MQGGGALHLRGGLAKGGQDFEDLKIRDWSLFEFEVRETLDYSAIRALDLSPADHRKI